MRAPQNEMEELEADMDAIAALHGSRPFNEMPEATQARFSDAFDRWEELFFDSLDEDEEVAQ